MMKRTAEQFRSNMRQLLKSRWLSQREAADQIGVPYKYMRRLCHEGIERIDRRTRDRLHQIAGFFELEIEDLWSEEVPFADPRRDRTLIKWTGSKRLQAEEIIGRFPREIETYREPFLGGGSVLYALLNNNIKVKRFRCSDTCEPLIQIWKLVQSDPERLLSSYADMREQLRFGGADFYLEVRDRFNERRDPCDFFFLLRNCRHGLVRFNTKGIFTVGFNHGRIGIPPEQVHTMLIEWNELLRRNDVRFDVWDFRDVKSGNGDVLYCDPPYDVGDDRYYSGNVDFGDLFGWLDRQRGLWFLSLNGFVGDEDRRVAVPPHLYGQEVQIDAGVSPMRSADSPRVTNSLYVGNSRST